MLVIELLEAEGLEKAHLVRKDDTAHLCLHYDPERFSVSQVRSLVQAAGTRIANRYRAIITEVKLELVCADERADTTVQLIRDNARTGQRRAGWVFVSDINAGYVIDDD